MVYLVGITGFICGFFAGQMLLLWLLRDYSKQEILELMKEPGQKFKYGMLNWAVAALGAFLLVYIYNNYWAGH